MAREGVVDGWFVWQNLDSELAVYVPESRAAVREGLVVAGLLTRCEEVEQQSELVVPIAIGRRGEPAGMILAAETVARGEDLLVEVWGEVAVAACWAALVDVATAVAAAAGEDADCAPLLPGAVYGEDEALVVVPQARHAIDVTADAWTERR